MDNKKKSSSSTAESSPPNPKRSKKASNTETDSNEIPVDEVHTANNWESADLGDAQRKQKFLRLMGAKKHKEEVQTNRQDSHGSNHSDNGSGEKKHCRSSAENETIERELEKQFNEGLQSKITHTHHGGLGFHGEGSGASAHSSDWQHQSTKAIFVPAKTEGGSSLEHVHVEPPTEDDDKKSDKKQEKSKDKKEKKRKSDS